MRGNKSPLSKPRHTAISRRGRRIGHPLRGNLVPLIGVGVAFGNVLRQHGFFCKYWFILTLLTLDYCPIGSFILKLFFTFYTTVAERAWRSGQISTWKDDSRYLIPHMMQWVVHQENSADLHSLIFIVLQLIEIIDNRNTATLWYDIAWSNNLNSYIF